jgi:hypothetical protein
MAIMKTDADRLKYAQWNLEESVKKAAFFWALMYEIANDQSPPDNPMDDEQVSIMLDLGMRGGLKRYLKMRDEGKSPKDMLDEIRHAERILLEDKLGDYWFREAIREPTERQDDGDA